FLSRGPGFGLYLTANAAVLAFARAGDPSTRDVVKLSFPGSASAPQVFGQGDLLSRSNYFTGAGRADWHTNVPNYSQVVYKNLYPGTALRSYGATGRRLEYDFIVNPGADPSSVRLQWDGAQSVSLDRLGNLVLRTGGGDVVQQAPTVYQTVNGARQAV